MAARVAGSATAKSLLVVLFLSSCSAAVAIRTHGGGYVSAVGDPGMRRDGLRVAWEAWNFCNEVGQEAPGIGSPRGADCFDIAATGDDQGQPVYKVVHRVTDADNALRAGDPFPGTSANSTVTDTDRYAAAKELYLGDRCQVPDSPEPWQFWMVMLKNGNLDTTAAICPDNGRPARPFPQTSRFPCPGGTGCMNQPLVFHNRTALDDAGRRLRGGLFGTYELDATDLGRNDVSYYSVVWEKQIDPAGGAGWVFHHKLRTSAKYPWLMLYLRSDATRGFSGGYHYERHDKDSAGVARFQGEADAGGEAGRGAQQPVLPDGHGQLLEERRHAVRRRHGHGRDPVQRDDHQPGDAGVVPAGAQGPVPAVAHVPQRHARAPRRRRAVPLRRLPCVLLAGERAARRAADHLLRPLQQPAAAGDPADRAAPGVGRVRVPHGQRAGLDRRPQGMGARRWGLVARAVFLPGSGHAAGEEAVVVA